MGEVRHHLRPPVMNHVQARYLETDMFVLGDGRHTLVRLAREVVESTPAKYHAKDFCKRMAIGFSAAIDLLAAKVQVPKSLPLIHRWFIASRCLPSCSND